MFLQQNMPFFNGPKCRNRVIEFTFCYGLGKCLISSDKFKYLDAVEPMLYFFVF